jgi:hypothetical protein
VREMTVKSSADVKHIQPVLIEGGREAVGVRTPQVTTHAKPNKISTPQFCALEYVPTAEGGVTRTIKHVILLVVRQADGVLQFLAHPNLHKVVEVTRLTYVLSLLEEFLARAKSDSEQVFRQLCSLACGSLLTWKVGEHIDEDPDIRDLSVQFMPL